MTNATSEIIGTLKEVREIEKIKGND